MTKFVSVIGNGESRRGFDVTVLKGITTVVGCNAIFRDHNLDYIVACDRHMCQEAANTCGKGRQEEGEEASADVAAVAVIIYCTSCRRARQE